MSDKKVQASAIVTLTIEIVVPDVWGGDCSLDQVQRQASDSAIGVLRRAMPKEFNQYNTGSVRLIGNPEVASVLVKR